MFDPFSLAVIGGLFLTGAGTAVAAKASMDQADAARKQASLQKRQASLQRARDLRASIRQMQMERAKQQALAGYQGMSFGGSSFQTAQGNVGSTTAQNVLGINQSFQAARQSANISMDMANAQALGSIGVGLTNLGGTLMSGAPSIQRVGTYASSGFGPTNIVPPGFYG